MDPTVPYSCICCDSLVDADKDTCGWQIREGESQKFQDSKDDNSLQCKKVSWRLPSVCHSGI